MSRTKNAVLLATLLFSALVSSGCATKHKEVPVAAPDEVIAAVEAPVEQPVVAEVVPEPAPAPIAVAEQPAPKPKARIIRKAKKKPIKVQPIQEVAPPPPPPPPIVEYVEPVVQPPPPPVAIAPPPEMPEMGFFEEYWLWLLVLGVLIAGIVVWWRSQAGKR